MTDAEAKKFLTRMALPRFSRVLWGHRIIRSAYGERWDAWTLTLPVLFTG